MAGSTKKKASPAAETPQASASIEETAVVASPDMADASGRPVKVIVLTVEEAADLVGRVYAKCLPDGVRVEVIPVAEPVSDLQSILEDLIARTDVNASFILVPPTLVPVTELQYLSALEMPVVDMNGEQETWWGRTPVPFSKEHLAEFLPEHADDDPDAFVKAYLKQFETRPLEVSHSFGNYYTKVLRANPCENVIIEAFVRKRFIYANRAGWPAVAPLLEKFLEG